MKYNVLWIDDDSLKKECELSESFMQLAELMDINIEAKDNYDDGLAWLKQNQKFCDAVILDVNCVQHCCKKESADMEVFTQNFHKVQSLCEVDNRIIPWFVYTGGGYDGDKFLHKSIPATEWSKKRYFSKPSHAKDLFDNIKEAIDGAPLLPLKRKYFKELELCTEHANNILVIADEIFNKREISTEPFNKLRDIMEWIKEYAKEHGVFSNKVISLSNANTFIKKIKDVDCVPLYVKDTFQVANNVVQEGSHSEDAGMSDGRKPVVKKHVREGVATRLVEAAFNNVIVLLEWCTKLPQSPEVIAKLREITDLIEIKQEDLTGIVQCEDNIYYCKDEHDNRICQILPKLVIDKNLLGKRVTLTGVTDNNNTRYNNKYPLFSSHIKSN